MGGLEENGKHKARARARKCDSELTCTGMQIGVDWRKLVVIEKNLRNETYYAGIKLCSHG